MNITSISPIWGVNIKPGYSGFITRERDFVGDGIEWFERYQTGLPFCHAFSIVEPPAVVDGATTSRAIPARASDIPIIEAHAGRGVSRATLGQYLGSKTCQCFIRIPAGYTDPDGSTITTGMEEQLGDKYAFGLILADAMANTYAGHLVNSWLGNVPDKIVCGLFTNAHHRICSQAVATALQKIPRLKIRGCLRYDAAMITPAQLGNDNVCFEPGIYRLV